MLGLEGSRLNFCNSAIEVLMGQKSLSKGLGNITLNSSARQLSQTRKLQTRTVCLTECKLHFTDLVILIQNKTISVSVPFSTLIAKHHCLLNFNWPLPFVVLTNSFFFYMYLSLLSNMQQKCFSSNICSHRKRKVLETLKGKIQAHFYIYFPTFSKLSKKCGLLGM